MMTRNKTKFVCAVTYKFRPKRTGSSFFEVVTEMKAGFMVVRKV